MDCTFVNNITAPILKQIIKKYTRFQGEQLKKEYKKKTEQLKEKISVFVLEINNIIENCRQSVMFNLLDKNLNILPIDIINIITKYYSAECVLYDTETEYGYTINNKKVGKWLYVTKAECNQYDQRLCRRLSDSSTYFISNNQKTYWEINSIKYIIEEYANGISKNYTLIQ